MFIYGYGHRKALLDFALLLEFMEQAHTLIFEPGQN